MSYNNRYQNNSPWAAGAPPVGYGGPPHMGPPQHNIYPPQPPAYQNQWAGPPMRQGGGGNWVGGAGPMPGGQRNMRVCNTLNIFTINLYFGLNEISF